MSDSISAHLLPDDQCVLMENVELFEASIGERRRGTSSVDVSESDLVNEAYISALMIHRPDTDLNTEELWAVAATTDTSATIARRVFGVWETITPVDALLTSSPDIFSIHSQSIHNKLFVSYLSDNDRLHVWDGTTLRPTGLRQPEAPPTADDTASGGSFTGDRLYRVRFIVKDVDDQVLLRSEPSEELTFTPSGTNDGADVTRPDVIDEGETHWELEASDGDGNFYLIDTVVIGTDTTTDQTQPATDYSVNGELSEDIGDYTLIPSVKYIVPDQDRLVFAGHRTDSTLSARVSWTPVSGATGVGNDERLPLDNDSFIDLDWMAGGEITGLSKPLNGSFYAFKWGSIYKLQRTGRVDGAYEAFLLSHMRGALPGSIVDGVDEFGRGCVYFIDPSLGPARISGQGLQHLQGVEVTYRTANTQAADVVSHGVYYPEKQQLHWWIAVANSDTPTLGLTLQVNEVRADLDGTTRGWSLFTGLKAQGLCSCLVSEAVTEVVVGPLTTATYTSWTHRPYIGLSDPDYIQRTDVGSLDNTTEYRARIVTKPYILSGLLGQFGARTAAILADPNSDPSVTLDVKFIRDFGKEVNTVNTHFLPERAAGDPRSESLVLRKFDSLVMSEAYAIQVEFSDPEL